MASSGTENNTTVKNVHYRGWILYISFSAVGEYNLNAIADDIDQDQTAQTCSLIFDLYHPLVKSSFQDINLSGSPWVVFLSPKEVGFINVA